MHAYNALSVDDFDGSPGWGYKDDGDDYEDGSEEDEFFPEVLRAPARRGAAEGAAVEPTGAEEEVDGEAAAASEEDSNGAIAAASLFASRGEAIIWCIDCYSRKFDVFEPTNFQATAAAAEGGHTSSNGSSRTLWEELLTACVSFLRRKVTTAGNAGRRRLLFALLLAGTSASQNPLEFPHLFCVPVSSNAAVAAESNAAVLGLQEVDVNMIQQLQQLARLRTRQELEQRLFHNISSSAPPSRALLSDLLWLSNHLFNTAAAPFRRSKGSRRAHAAIQQRLLLFTSDDTPCDGLGASAVVAAVQRLRDLQEENVDFLLVPLETPAHAFVMEHFWSEALLIEDETADLSKISSSDTSAGLAYKRQVRLRLDAINDNVRLVDRSQRVLTVLPLHVLPSLRFPVCMIVSVKATPAMPRPQVLLAAPNTGDLEEIRPAMRMRLIASDNNSSAAAVTSSASARAPAADADAEATAHSKDFLEEDLEQLLLLQARRGDEQHGVVGQQLLGLYVENKDERIGVDPRDMHAVHDFGEAGLWLLGFKKQDSVQLHMNLRNALFIVPQSAALAAAGGPAAAHAARAAREAGVPAGAAAQQEKFFSALLLTMYQKNLAAYVRYVMRNGSAPGLAALLPQLEEVDEAGNTLQPPGLHFIRLPFADEIRALPLSWSCIAEQEQQEETSLLAEAATPGKAPQMQRLEEQVQLAEQALRGLFVEDFYPQQLSNDALQRHFAVIEALAVGLTTPDVPKPSLVPDQAAFDRAKSLLLDWKECVYGTRDIEYSPTAAAVAGKRKSSSTIKSSWTANTPKSKRNNSSNTTTTSTTSSSSNRSRAKRAARSRATVAKAERPPVLSPGAASVIASSPAVDIAGEIPSEKSRKNSRERRSGKGQPADEEVQRLAAEQKLHLLTVAQLTAWVAAQRLQPRNRKADLIKQVQAVFEMGSRSNSYNSSSQDSRRRSITRRRGKPSSSRNRDKGRSSSNSSSSSGSGRGTSSPSTGRCSSTEEELSGGGTPTRRRVRGSRSPDGSTLQGGGGEDQFRAFEEPADNQLFSDDEF